MLRALSLMQLVNQFGPMRRFCLGLMVVGQGVLWWRAIYWYPQLPERFPIHFNFAGEPDGWADKSIAMWLMLPGISLVMLAFLGGISYWMGSLVRNTPGLVNVPRKDLFVKMSVAGRMTVVAPTQTFLAWVLALMTFLFVWIVEGTGRVAVHEDATVAVWPVFIFLVGVLGVLPFYWVATSRRLTDAAMREGLIPRPSNNAVS